MTPCFCYWTLSCSHLVSCPVPAACSSSEDPLTGMTCVRTACNARVRLLSWHIWLASARERLCLVKGAVGVLQHYYSEVKQATMHGLLVAETKLRGEPLGLSPSRRDVFFPTRRFGIISILSMHSSVASGAIVSRMLVNSCNVCDSLVYDLRRVQQGARWAAWSPGSAAAACRESFGARQDNSGPRPGTVHSPGGYVRQTYNLDPDTI